MSKIVDLVIAVFLGLLLLWCLRKLLRKVIVGAYRSIFMREEYQRMIEEFNKENYPELTEDDKKTTEGNIGAKEVQMSTGKYPEVNCEELAPDLEESSNGN